MTLAPGATCGVLDLDEIADLGFLGKRRAGTQSREGTDARAGRRRARLRDARRRGSRAPSAISTPGPMTTCGSIVTSRPIYVSAQRKTVSGAIIVAPPRHGGAAQTRLRDGFGLRELDAVVDAEHFALRRRRRLALRSPVGARELDDVGEIEFALGVVVVDLFAAGAAPRRPSIAIRPPLQQRDRAFFVAGVFFLADGDEPPRFVAQQPSVAEGVRRLRNPERRDGRALGQGGAQGADRRRPSPAACRRRAPAGRRILRAMACARGENGVRRAEPFALHEDFRAQRHSGALPRRRRRVPGRRSRRRGRRPPSTALDSTLREHGAAGDLVQHLRAVGFHPRAFAGGKDDRERASVFAEASGAQG